MSDHAQYQDSFHTASDWLKLHRERLFNCSDVTGDKHTLLSKLDRAQDLTNALPDGTAKIETCVTNSEQTLPNTGAEGQQVIQEEVASLKLEWSEYQDALGDSKTKLEDALNKWKVRHLSFLSCGGRTCKQIAKDFFLGRLSPEGRRCYCSCSKRNTAHCPNG